MRIRTRTRSNAAVTAAVAAIGLALPLAACGSSTSSSTSSSTGATPAAGSTVGTSADAATRGVTQARVEIAKYSGLSNSFTPPGPPVHAAALLRGKTVWYVPVFLEAGYFQVEEKALAGALAPLGAKLQTCDGKDSPTAASACITQAVSSGAAGIVTSAVPVSFAQQAYIDAVDHKIPVVASQNAAPAPDTPSFNRYFVGTGLNEALAGSLVADPVIADSNGHASVLFADDTTDGLTAELGAGIEHAFATDCPGCKIAKMTFQDSELQNVPAQVQAAIAKDPGVGYVVTQYDDPSGLEVAQGAQQANPSIKFAAVGGTPSMLARVGQGAQLADSGVDPVSNAWNLTDALLRILAGKPSVATHYVVPHRLFTKANTTPIAGQLKDPAAWTSGQWYSNGAFKPAYLK